MLLSRTDIFKMTKMEQKSDTNPEFRFCEAEIRLSVRGSMRGARNVSSVNSGRSASRITVLRSEIVVFLLKIRALAGPVSFSNDHLSIPTSAPYPYGRPQPCQAGSSMFFTSADHHY